MVPCVRHGRKLPGGSRSLTLAELATAVGIVAILAAIAIPAMRSGTASAKRSEVTTNLSDIETMLNMAEAAGEIDGLEEKSWIPDAAPGRDLRPWETGTGFQTLGWSPDGDVRCSYRFKRPGNSGHLNPQGACDVDGDGREYQCDALLTAGKTVMPLDCAPDDAY